MKRFLKIIGFLILFLLLLVVGFIIYVKYAIHVDPPVISREEMSHHTVHRTSDVRTLDENWLRHDSTGIWEMYIEGSPFKRGQAVGLLAEDLLDFQEEVFVDQIEGFVPSELYRSFLLRMVKFYNRNLDDYIPSEYLQEIYGVSLSAPDQFSYLGTNYERKLSYHAAHDIGHAFQNMGFVSGCSALSAVDSASGDVLLGRNFDFYVGDEFAKNKIVACMRPDSGYAFVSLTWAGMMGVVSGMNEHGLAVIINAGPSEMPKGARTPVTLIAREILQYSRSIEDAIQIAQHRDVFVAENFIIASGEENRIVLIEKSPDKTTVLEQSTQNFTCTNHFLSEDSKNLPSNIEAIDMTSSDERFDQINYIRSQSPINSVDKIARALRTTVDINGEPLGFGNEMAINQLTAHHSIIFNVNKKQIYIAGVPSQIGPYLMYDLDDIFNSKYKTPQRLWSDFIPADSFLYSTAYSDYLKFKNEKIILEQVIKNEGTWKLERIESFIKLNPDLYETYLLVGHYYEMKNQKAEAEKYYQEALKRPIPWERDRDAILRAINKL